MCCVSWLFVIPASTPGHMLSRETFMYRRLRENALRNLDVAPAVNLAVNLQSTVLV
jgi:hypothetical protein